MTSPWMPFLYNSVSMEEFCLEIAHGGWNCHVLFDEFLEHISLIFYARFFYSCLVSHTIESCMTRDSLYELHFRNYLSSPLLFFRQILGIPSPYVFEVLRAVHMKSAVCWNVVTYRLVRIYWRFERTLIFHILSTRVDAPVLWMRRQQVPLHGRKIFLPDYVASLSKRCTAPMFRVEQCLFFYHKNGVSCFVTLVDISRLQIVPHLSERLFLWWPIGIVFNVGKQQIIYAEDEVRISKTSVVILPESKMLHFRVKE